MKRRRLTGLAVVLAAVTAAGITGCEAVRDHREQDGRADTSGGQRAFSRDWARYPAIVDRTTDAEVVAVSDVHGSYDRLVALLSANGLVAADGGSPVKYSWAGGSRILVCVGDLVDKGAQSVEVLDLMMKLEAEAPRSGGEVIVTIGNHEAAFLDDPLNKKAKEFDDELVAKGLEPSSVATANSPYGLWLMNRPVAAKVNSWFFAHAGNTAGATEGEIAKGFREAVDAGDWGAQSLLGDDSILESQGWWKAPADVDRDLAAIGARHIVFGHDPGAFKNPGVMEQRDDGKLVLIDVGMSPAVDYSRGALLLIDRQGGDDVATSVDAAGNRTELWRGPGVR